MKTSFILLLVACLFMNTLCTEQIWKKIADKAKTVFTKDKAKDAGKSAGGLAATTAAGAAINCGKAGCHNEKCQIAGSIKPSNCPKGSVNQARKDCYNKAVCSANGASCAWASKTDLNNCLKSVKAPLEK